MAYITDIYIMGYYIPIKISNLFRFVLFLLYIVCVEKRILLHRKQGLTEQNVGETIIITLTDKHVTKIICGLEF